MSIESSFDVSTSINFLLFVLSTILCIRLLLVKNKDFKYLRNIKTLLVIYFATLVSFFVLLTFKTLGFMTYSNNILKIILIIPYIFSLLEFIKTPFDLNDGKEVIQLGEEQIKQETLVDEK